MTPPPRCTIQRMSVRRAIAALAMGLLVVTLVALWPNSKPDLIPVPNVEGLQLRDAIVRLEQVSLTTWADGRCVRIVHMLKERRDVERVSAQARGEKLIDTGGGLSTIQVGHQTPPPGTIVVRGARVDLQERCWLLG